MPLDPNISLSYQPPQIQNPLSTLAQVQALKNQQLQSQSGQLELQQQQLNMQQQQAVMRAFANSGGDMDKALQEISTTAPLQYMALRGQQINLQKAYDEHAEAVRKDALYQNDMAGRDAQYVLDQKPEVRPYAYLTKRPGWIQKNPALEQQLPPTWNDSLEPVLQGIVARSQSVKDQAATQQTLQQTAASKAQTQKTTLDTQRERLSQASAQLAASPPADANEYAKAVSEFDPQTALTIFKAVPASQYDPKTSPALLSKLGLTSEQQVTTAQAAATEAERARHNKVMENLQQQVLTGGVLSPEATQMAAQLFAQTGIMVPLGNGPNAARNRDNILNAAAQNQPGANIAANRATYGADKASLQRLVGQRDAVAAFENTASKNLDQFLNLAKGMIDSGSPLINRPLREIGANVFGSDQLAVNAARQVAVNEIAKVTGNPNLTGSLTDSARKEVEAYLPQNATLAQTYKVAQVLRQDMKNRHDEMNRQIAEIQGRMGGQQPAAEQSGGNAGNAQQQYKAGDMVMYQGKPHRISAVDPQTGKLTLEP